MLRELEQQGYTEPVYLFYSNKTELTAAYHRQLTKTGLKNYSYVPVFTESQERININMLKNKLNDLPAIDFYIVGELYFP